MVWEAQTWVCGDITPQPKQSDSFTSEKPLRTWRPLWFNFPISIAPKKKEILNTKDTKNAKGETQLSDLYTLLILNHLILQPK